MVTKKKTTRKTPSKRKRKKGKSGFFSSITSTFGKVPTFLLWGIFAFLVVAYVVFFYKTFVGPYSFRWKALYTNVTYPEGKVRGIDISHHQGEIDWDKLRNTTIQGAPISFVFAKATQGTDVWDENFNQNFFNAKKNDMVRGAYHYYSPLTSAKLQAKHFCKVVQLDEKDLPPVLDVEETGALSKRELQKEVKIWLNYVEKHYGATPIIYASYSFKMQYLSSPDFDKYPFWIAHYYVDSLQYKGKWTFWQHTDAGKLDGISEDVDLNIFNGDMQDLMDMTIKE